jgi:hypothetical protein
MRTATASVLRAFTSSVAATPPRRTDGAVPSAEGDRLTPSSSSSVTSTLVAGVVLATMVSVLAFVGAALGVDALWPVLLAAGLGLVVGMPRGAHVVMVGLGASVAVVAAGLQLAVLPAVPAARAAALAGSVLVLALIAVASRGRLPFGVALIGWGAATAFLEPAVAAAPAAFVTIAGVTLATMLVSFGVGLLVAQVVALLTAPASVSPPVSPSASPSASAGGPVAALLLVALVTFGLTSTPSVAAQAQEGPAVGTVGPAAALWNGAGRSGTVEGDVDTLAHRQVVLVPSGPDGAARPGFVITQLHVRGSGPVRITLEDQATAGLRDTGAFRAPRVEGTTVVHELDLGPTVPNGGVNGSAYSAANGAVLVRTVATLERTLPVELSVAYALDDVPVTPAQLVGRSGRLTITYTLTNLTAELREVRHFDGLGRARTEAREVAVPMGATVALRLDPRFSGVTSDGASVIAGDGTGATRISASLALFGPSGAATRSFAVSADVVDAVVPSAEIRVVPLGARTSPDWRASVNTLGVFGGALDAASDAAGILGTSATALGTFVPRDGSPAEVVLDQLASIVAGLGAALNDGAAGVDANLAWLAAQDARFEAGEGFVHGVLADADVTVVYAFDVAGLGEDGGPSLPLRLAVGLGLFAVVALLGRSVSSLGTTGDGR